jgi:RHS repeat-associated protein
LSYLLGDHLGSTSLTTDALGNKVSELHYKAWGEVRYASGNTPTQYQYTGQFSYESEFGLYFYNARWYDSSLGRFAQADTIIPEQTQGVQAWDRYAYTNNNPLRYNDPTGHCIICAAAQWVDSILNPSPATIQAVTLVGSWFTELGEQSTTYGPDEPITQEVMQQTGVDDFHDAWAAHGYADGYSTNTTIDNRSTGSFASRVLKGMGVLIDAHFIELPLALSGAEGHSAIPGTIGSLDTISATYTEDGRVKIEVHNTMGWASGTRIPGTKISIILDRHRDEFGR